MGELRRGCAASEGSCRRSLATTIVRTCTLLCPPKEGRLLPQRSEESREEQLIHAKLEGLAPLGSSCKLALQREATLSAMALRDRPL